jgi:hypothetical protein
MSNHRHGGPGDYRTFSADHRLKRAHQRGTSGGFILTLELLLLLAIFGTVVVFALILVQQHFVKSVSNPFGRTVFVYDSTLPSGSSLLIGRAVGFNQLEAPQIIYRINDPAEPVAALLGVRPANFTTRPSVFYDSATCTGGSWMLDPTNPAAGAWGEVSDFYSTQGTAFAIGSAGGSQNVLYRSTPGAAPAVMPQSHWVSERYTLNCQPVAPDAALQAALIPATPISNLSTIYLPPYWTPDKVAGTPLSATSAPQKEGDPWP